MRRALLAAVTLLAVGALAGCGSSTANRAAPPTTTQGTPSAPATTATSTTTAPGTETVRVYLLRAGDVTPVARQIEPTQAVARAALEQLLAGPSGDERSAGLATDVPSDAKLEGVTIGGGVATVDLDAAFVRGAEATIAPRLAQVVYTVTQFPTVSAVRFEQDGAPMPGVVDGHGIPLERPATRTDYEALTPAILIESPLPGETVTSPIQLRGSAVAFEATFQAEVVDASGAVVGRQTVTASEGAPARGTFAATVPVTHAATGPVQLVAYEDNQGTGARMHVVTVPLHLDR